MAAADDQASQPVAPQLFGNPPGAGDGFGPPPPPPPPIAPRDGGREACWHCGHDDHFATSCPTRYYPPMGISPMDQFKYLQRFGGTPYGNFNVLWMQLLVARGDTRLDPSSHPPEQLLLAIECWKERIATRNASPDGPPTAPAYQWRVPSDGHPWDSARCDRVLAGASNDAARQFITRGIGLVLIAAERATRAPPSEWQGGARPRPTCLTTGCSRALANHCLRHGWEHCCATCRAGRGGHDDRCWCAENPRAFGNGMGDAANRGAPTPQREGRTRPTCISPGCFRPLADYVLVQGWEHCCATCRSGGGAHWSQCWDGEDLDRLPTTDQVPTPPMQQASSSTAAITTMLWNATVGAGAATHDDQGNPWSDLA